MKKIVVLLFVLGFLSLKLVAQSSITVDDVGRHAGENVILCGKVVGAKAGDGKQATIVSVGGGFSNTKVNLTINPNDRRNFPYKPEAYLLNKDVCVTGTLTNAGGRIEISVGKDEQIIVQDAGGDEGLPFNPLSKYFDWE